VVIRIRSNRAAIHRIAHEDGRRGAMTVQLAIILVPVVFGLMAFAIDLGRLYLIRGELNQAASAMAMAAAAQLNGTAAATGSAAAAANALINSYNFGSIVVGQGNGFLNSATPTLSFYADRADAVSGGAAVDGTMAQYVSVSLAADAPLTFGGLFSSLLSHTTSVAAFAVAGLSAPLCTACDIDVFAVAPIGGGVAPDFGFVAGTLYTFYFDCTGAPTPPLLSGTTGPAVPYVLINGYNTSSSELEDQQLFQTGAQGLLPSPYSSTSQSCVAVNQAQTLWGSSSGANVPGVTVSPGTCASGANTLVEDALCGLSARLTSTLATFCTNSSDLDTVSTQYTPDTDTTFYAADTYTSYMGNNLRILTLPIVDGLTTLNVQCFRQFLLEPDDATGDANNPTDANGRFIAMYLGVVAPVKQGRFDGACGISTGPGKVVLQQ
jgi:Flp pilus assembly protein TadG